MCALPPCTTEYNHDVPLIFSFSPLQCTSCSYHWMGLRIVGSGHPTSSAMLGEAVIFFLKDHFISLLSLTPFAPCPTAFCCLSGLWVILDQDDVNFTFSFLSMKMQFWEGWFFFFLGFYILICVLCKKVCVVMWSVFSEAGTEILYDLERFGTFPNSLRI